MSTKAVHSKPCCHYYSWNEERWRSLVKANDFESLWQWIEVADENFRNFIESSDQSSTDRQLCERCRIVRAMASVAEDARGTGVMPPLEDANSK